VPRRAVTRPGDRQQERSNSLNEKGAGLRGDIGTEHATRFTVYSREGSPRAMSEPETAQTRPIRAG
jgi:hypothetical protein